MDLLKKGLILIGMIAAFTVMGFSLYDAYLRITIEKQLVSYADQILQQMSLEEKVGQLVHVGMVGTQIDAAVKEEIGKRKVGGIILFARNIASSADVKVLNEQLQQLSLETTGIPLLISVDQEGGRVQRVTEGTIQFPGAMALGQTGNESYAEDAAFITGYELRELGLNFILAPVLDVNNNPSNPVINTRSLGSDPLLVSRMGRAFVRGLRKSLSVPAIKHFPGHGDTDTDSHLDLPKIGKTVHDLEQIELVPFKSSIAEGAEVVMNAHILFPSLDQKFPATLSREIIENLLRKKLGFKGLVITDAMEMDAIARNYSEWEAVRHAVRAGADIILLTSTGERSNTMVRSLLEGYQSGELSMEELNRSVKRQLLLKIQKGIMTGYPIEKLRVAPSDTVLSYINARIAQTDRQYQDLIKKYNGNLENLNIQISRESIKSLRKPFAAISHEELKQARYLIESPELRAELAAQFPAGSLPVYEDSDLRTLLQQTPGQTPIIVEIQGSNRSSWNQTIAALPIHDRRRIVGLYTGNPFVQLEIPPAGGVLVSFSTTETSKRALIYRLVHGSIEQAHLILKNPTGKTRSTANNKK